MFRLSMVMWLSCSSASAAMTEMAGFGQVQVVPKQVLVLHCGTLGREHATTGLVHFPYRRCSSS